MMTLLLVSAVRAYPERTCEGCAGAAESPIEPVAVLLHGVADRLLPGVRSPEANDLARILVHSMLDPSRPLREEPLGRRDGYWEAVLTRRWQGDKFVEGLGTAADALGQRGEFVRRTRIKEIRPRLFEWESTESIAVGELALDELRVSARSLLIAIEKGVERQDGLGLPAVSALLDGIVAVDSSVTAAPGGGAYFALSGSVALTQAGRRRQPAIAALLGKHVAPLNVSVRVRDDRSRTWMTLRLSGGSFELRMRIRDGALLPLEGHREEGELEPRLFVEYAGDTKKGPFRVGVRQAVGELGFESAADRLGMEVRLRTIPKWRLPFLVKPLLLGSLNRLFSEEGIRWRWSISRSGKNVQLVRELMFCVQPSWQLSWLGHPILDARADIRPKMGQFLADAVIALTDDLRLNVDRTPLERAQAEPSHR
jgi:hypothetical protein